MMPEKGVSGDFDYLWEKTDESEGAGVGDAADTTGVGDAAYTYASETDFDYLMADAEPGTGDGFDAFDEKTWGDDFTPVSRPPWYRSPQSRTLLVASATALSAIVVSVVLLIVRGPVAREAPAPVQTSTTAATPLATASSEMSTPPPAPPPSLPPAPAPPAPPSLEYQAPAVVRPTQRPRPTTKQPEIGVTRTPITRMPLSVAPQPHPTR
jgi:hypothetical protein